MAAPRNLAWFVIVFAFVGTLPGSSAVAQSNASSSAQPQDQKSTSPQSASQGTTQTDSAGQPQSLADAARKASAEKDKPKAKRVYTEDDLANIHGTISVVGDKSSDSGDRDQADDTPRSSAGNNEAYWRSRARNIKEQISDTDRRIAEVKAEIAKSGAASFDPSTGLSQGVIIIHDRNAQVKQLEDRKASLQRQLDDLADEARKAGADSGWTR